MSLYKQLKFKHFLAFAYATKALKTLLNFFSITKENHSISNKPVHSQNHCMNDPNRGINDPNRFIDTVLFSTLMKCVSLHQRTLLLVYLQSCWNNNIRSRTTTCWCNTHTHAQKTVTYVAICERSKRIRVWSIEKYKNQEAIVHPRFQSLFWTTIIILLLLLRYSWESRFEKMFPQARQNNFESRAVTNSWHEDFESRAHL